MNRFLFASALAAALAAAPLVALAGPNRDGRPGAGRAGQEGAGRAGRRMRHRGMRRARHAMKVLKSLDLTDAQKALLADGRAGAEAVRADLRARIKAVFETPVTGEKPDEMRAARRAKIKEMIEAARTQVEPSAAKFVSALSPEQKAKLSELAQKRGKTFDEAKFTKRVAGLFLAPKSERGHRHGDR
jgi:Spy/CpxP family protein refolding chaperone